MNKHCVHSTRTHLHAVPDRGRGQGGGAAERAAGPPPAPCGEADAGRRGAPTVREPRAGVRESPLGGRPPARGPHWSPVRPQIPGPSGSSLSLISRLFWHLPLCPNLSVPPSRLAGLRVRLPVLVTTCRPVSQCPRRTHVTAPDPLAGFHSLAPSPPLPEPPAFSHMGFLRSEAGSSPARQEPQKRPGCEAVPAPL